MRCLHRGRSLRCSGCAGRCDQCSCSTCGRTSCSGRKGLSDRFPQSREPAAALILQELGVHPVIDGSLALGEGTGAVLMFGLLDTVHAVYGNRTTFSDIRVEAYKRFTDV